MLDTPFPSPYVDPGVAVEFGAQAIRPGDTGTLHLEATVRNMIYQDTDDTEYASLQFAPTYYDSDYVYGDTRLEVNFAFPPGVGSEDPRYHEQEFTEARVEDGRVIYTWVREDASPSREYRYGASFPKAVLAEGVVQAAPAFNIDFTACCNSPLIWIALFGGGWALLAALGARSQKKRKMQYLPPSLAVEGTGIKRGLTAVEAAVLLEAPLNKVVTMILFGLVKKGVVAVESEKPLKLRVLREESPDLKLWYYERRFVKAVEEDGRLDESALRDMIIDLIGDVNKKLTGFARNDTKAYYKDIAARAWNQVEAADTPEVLGKRWSEGLEWTMLQDDWDDRTRDVFRDRPVVLALSAVASNHHRLDFLIGSGRALDGKAGTLEAANEPNGGIDRALAVSTEGLAVVDAVDPRWTSGQELERCFAGLSAIEPTLEECSARSGEGVLLLRRIHRDARD